MVWKVKGAGPMLVALVLVKARENWRFGRGGWEGKKLPDARSAKCLVSLQEWRAERLGRWGDWAGCGRPGERAL